MAKFIINLCLWGVLGYALAEANVASSSWQFWVVLVAVSGIALTT